MHRPLGYRHQLDQAQQGFILTRHWRWDTAAGTEVEFWLSTDRGPQKIRLAPQTSVEVRSGGAARACRAVRRRARQAELRAAEDGSGFPASPGARILLAPAAAAKCGQLAALEKSAYSAGWRSGLQADIRPPERAI